MEIDVEKIDQFHLKLFSWYKSNKKNYPWRDTENPYHILVSEFMLQQTQASRVINKYLNFIKIFPDLKTLATSDKQKILAEWSGLGYNRRAIWLQEAAESLLKFDHFPKSPEILKKLKGIGDYSSRSIPIFAFNSNLATVDTNIRRILIHEGFAKEETKNRELFNIAQKLLPPNKSREYHSALMDYGSTILTAKKTGIKSKTTQSKFKGSNRQFRGLVIKLLTQNKNLTQKDLFNMIQNPPKNFDKILTSLIKDGLINKKNDEFFI